MLMSKAMSSAYGSRGVGTVEVQCDDDFVDRGTGGVKLKPALLSSLRLSREFERNALVQKIMEHKVPRRCAHVQ